VHQAGYRTDRQIQSELDFMEYLNGEGIRTPQVIHARGGRSFVVAEHGDVEEPRQCDLFEWIDGRPLRQSGQMPDMPVGEAAQMYAEVGRQAAAIYDASERWERPATFERPVWDVEGMFGPGANLGDFREIEDVTAAQRDVLERLADALAEDIEAFGKTPDRYGLSHGDFLAENLFVCEDGLRLIDFDDAGESWHLFDVATALFDLEGTDYFDPCLEGLVRGFRERRALPEEHLAMLPTFILARMLSYLGHAVSRTHLAQSAPLRMYFVGMLEFRGAEYLASRS
jgi:Ser/Thr protein kinase RdoA (MazF antagonist)